MYCLRAPGAANLICLDFVCFIASAAHCVGVVLSLCCVDAAHAHFLSPRVSGFFSVCSLREREVTPNLIESNQRAQTYGIINFRQNAMVNLNANKFCVLLPCTALQTYKYLI